MADLIDRAKAIEELEGMAECERKHGDALFAEGIDAAADRLRIMRHENPVRHAHWEILRCVRGRAFWGCSNCRTAVSVVSPTWPYCPYCGARMKETKNNG